MSGTGKRDVERLLRAHYRAERGAPDAASKAATLAAVRAAVASGRPAGARMGAEAAAGACAGERGRRATFAGFVAAQARFIHPRVWVAQLALVAAASLGWAVREVRTWLGSIAAGLDVFAPAPTPR